MRERGGFIVIEAGLMLDVLNRSGTVGDSANRRPSCPQMALVPNQD